MVDKMIWDAKYSERSFDDNGYLHVAMTPISKATVNPYKGSELQGLTDTRLEQDRIYYGYRAPEELAKGAKTFNGLFLLDEHHEIDAMSIPKQYIIGTVGTDAVFKDGYLYNSLVIADQDAINCVEDKSKWEISSAYKFVPVFKEGEVETEGGDKIHYDFIMTDIRGNHVALVPEGRAGHDVRVADSKGELKKMEKQQICSAGALECELFSKGPAKLSEIKDIISTKNLDLKILNVIEGANNTIVSVIVGNDGHTFNIAYDETGSLKVVELLSDAAAEMVGNAYNKGIIEAAKIHAQEHQVHEMAHEMAHHITEKEQCGANTVVVMEKPMAVEPISAPVDMMTAPILPPCDTLSEVIADDGVEVNMELNKDELAKVEELDQKDDGYAEKSFYDIRDRFSDARFNNYDDFVKEIGKYGVVPGKVTVVESGITYSVKCDKGGKVFTVEFKQQPNCIEIAKVYDEEQISTKELQIKENQDAEQTEEEPETEIVAEKVEKEIHSPIVEKVPSLRIATDKRTTRRGLKVTKDSDKLSALKKTAEEIGKKMANDKFPPKNMPKKKNGKAVKDSDDKLKNTLLEKDVKTGKIAKAAGIGSKQLKAENNKNQKVAKKPVPKVVTQKTVKPKTKEPDYDNMSAVEIMKATKGKGVPDKVAKDGGPGSGRKKGSKNINKIVAGLPSYHTDRQRNVHQAMKTGRAMNQNLNKAGKKLKNQIRSEGRNVTAKEKAKIQQIANKTKSSENYLNKNFLKAKKSGNPDKVARFTPIVSIDSKKKVKGCVGDASMEEPMMINNVFGLLMDVLSDNFGVADGGPGSGNFGHGGRPGQQGGSSMGNNGSGSSNNYTDEYEPNDTQDDEAEFEAWNEKYGGNYKDPEDAFLAFEQGLKGEPIGAGMEDYMKDYMEDYVDDYR